MHYILETWGDAEDPCEDRRFQGRRQELPGRVPGTMPLRKSGTLGTLGTLTTVTAERLKIYWKICLSCFFFCFVFNVLLLLLLLLLLFQSLGCRLVTFRGSKSNGKRSLRNMPQSGENAVTGNYDKSPSLCIQVFDMFQNFMCLWHAI